MATPAYEQGDTIRVRVTFRDWAETPGTGAIVDPDTVEVNLFRADESLLLGGEAPVKESNGIYYYDWILPIEAGSYFIEFKGMLGAYPTLERQKIKVKWDVAT